MTFRDLVLERLDEYGWSRCDLAELVPDRPCSPTPIYRWLAGTTDGINTSTLEWIFEVLSIEVRPT